MKKTLLPLSLLLISLNSFADYKIIIKNNNFSLPEKNNVIESCKSLNSSQSSGFYTFEVNGQSYETYCYNYNGNFWTLIGYYNNLSNFQEKPNLNTLNTEGYLPREIWDEISKDMQGIVFSPTYANESKAAKLDTNSLKNGSCHPFNYFDTTITVRQRIFHDEDLECTGSGVDYTTIELNHPHSVDTVGFWNFSSDANIQAIGDFFNNTGGYENVEIYGNVYFFMY